MTFQLHSRLQKDSIELGQFNLSRLLLCNDSQYPWFILVPQRPDISEIYQLTEKDQQLLQRESSLLAKTLSQLFQADKMNIAAIGNIVPQLHIHHIVRYKNDIAWPAPVWGKYNAIPYNKEQQQKISSKVKEALKESLIN